MANKVLIPTPLRVYAGKQDVVEAEGKTVGELLENLTSQYAELRNHLYNEDGRLRSFVNVYVNDDDIRTWIQEKKPAVKEGDSRSAVTTVASPVGGGRPGGIGRDRDEGGVEQTWRLLATVGT